MSTTDPLSREEIDHEAEAKRLLEETAPFQDQHLEVAMSSAQVHATLALVAVQREANEQQRIGNLIAVASSEAMDISRPWSSMPAEYESMRREIRDALGIGGDDAATS